MEGFIYKLQTQCLSSKCIQLYLFVINHLCINWPIFPLLCQLQLLRPLFCSQGMEFHRAIWLRRQIGFAINLANAHSKLLRFLRLRHLFRLPKLSHFLMILWSKTRTYSQLLLSQSKNTKLFSCLHITVMRFWIRYFKRPKLHLLFLLSTAHLLPSLPWNWLQELNSWILSF